MIKVLFTIGIPSSGKSTWSKKYCIKNKDWIRICRDDLRHMRGLYWLVKQENLITNMEISCMNNALEAGYNVIIDATNFNKQHIAKLRLCAMGATAEEVEFETKFFDVPVEECIKRDLKRENSVGEKVIRGFYDKYLKKDIKIKQDETLPKAIIIDLDGTLAYKENFVPNPRGYYDYSRVYEDLVNEPILKIVKAYKGNLIFMSGREDYCMEDTKKWFKDKAGISRDSYEIYMRKSGDNRKDTIVKKELFDKYIKDKYYVEFVLDDRNCVVQLWRDMGLTCLQVAEGEF